MKNTPETFQNVDPADIRREIEGSPLAKIVSETMGVPNFVEAALQLLKSPGLMSCTRESVLGGLLKAAIFNFRLSPELGECWLIPRNIKIGEDENRRPIFSTVAVFQIGYKGWQTLVFRSGFVESFSSELVWENDTFDYMEGTEPFLKHKPAANPSNRGKRTHVWAKAVMMSGRTVFKVVDIDEVERHRLFSDSQVSWRDNGSGKKTKEIAKEAVGIWGTHYDAMAKRIPIKYLCQLQLPKSEQMQKALESDGGVTNLVDGKLTETTPTDVMESTPVELHPDYVDELELQIRDLKPESSPEQVLAMKANLTDVYKRQSREMSPELLHKYQIEFKKIWDKLPSQKAYETDGTGN